MKMLRKGFGSQKSLIALSARQSPSLLTQEDKVDLITGLKVNDTASEKDKPKKEKKEG